MSAAPSEAEFLRRIMDARVSQIHTSIPGKVVTYDTALQTCKISISIKDFVPTEDGDVVSEEAAELVNVPVLFPGGGDFQMVWTLQPGDHVLVVFAERATSAWRLSGEQAEAGDVRRHSLNGAFAIPCIRPITDPITNLLPNATVVSVPSGGIVFGNALLAQFLARADKVDAALNVLFTWANAHVHTGVTTGPGSSGSTATPCPAIPPTAATKVKAE